MKSPDRFDFANRFLYVGSMQGEVPMMFAIVAVGAIAITFELRMPWAAIFARSGAQSSRPPRDDVDRLAALVLEQLARVSCGSRPRSHFEPG